MNTFKHIYTHKVKIKPTKNQSEKFDFWFRKCKLLYNIALEEKLIFHKETNKYLNLYVQKKELVDIKLYDKSWNDVPNKSLQEIIFRVDKAFKNFFNGSGFPKFKKELNSIEFVKTDVRLKDNKLFLPKIKQSIYYTEEIKNNWTSVKLTKSNNEYYLIFLYKEDVEINIENEDVLGVDLGLMSLYTDSNGNKVNRFSKKLINKYQNRIANLSRSLSVKKKGSIKYKKVKNNLNKAYNRLKCSKNDYLHKKSLELVRDSKESIIALGDIEIKNILDNRKTKKGLIKSFYINSLGIFKQYVMYKSVKYNKLCKLIDECMTSKTCSCCGNIKYDLKLENRIYDCLVCKNSIDRDENSAINMKLLGSSSLSKDKLVSLNGNNKLFTNEYNL